MKGETIKFQENNLEEYFHNLKERVLEWDKKCTNDKGNFIIGIH